MVQPRPFNDSTPLTIDTERSRTKSRDEAAGLKRKLKLIYHKALSCLGPQHWWPGDSPFEVMVGAILTQNTNWFNVEKAIKNLKDHNLLNYKRLYNLSDGKLAKLIRSAGYYNIKAKRLKNFLKFFSERCQGDIKRMSLVGTEALREDLLKVNGIGPETADSILLYALNKPVFVVDAYTKRIFFRHGLIKENAAYEEIQDLFMQFLRKDVELFNEYHALLVRIGKDFCLKHKPRCRLCPLEE